MPGRERDALGRFIRSREPTPIKTPNDPRIDIARRIPILEDDENTPESPLENTRKIAGKNSRGRSGGSSSGYRVALFVMPKGTKRNIVKLTTLDIEKLSRENVKIQKAEIRRFLRI